MTPDITQKLTQIRQQLESQWNAEQISVEVDRFIAESVQPLVAEGLDEDAALDLFFQVAESDLDVPGDDATIEEMVQWLDAAQAAHIADKVRAAALANK